MGKWENSLFQENKCFELQFWSKTSIENHCHDMSTVIKMPLFKTIERDQYLGWSDWKTRNFAMFEGQSLVINCVMEAAEPWRVSGCLDLCVAPQLL